MEGECKEGRGGEGMRGTGREKREEEMKEKGKRPVKCSQCESNQLVLRK